MITNKTLYISDLDGTLLNSSAKLSEYTSTTLNSLIAQGLNFSVATARLLPPVCEMLASVKINTPIILMNGVLIYDLNQEKYIKINKFLPEITKKIIQIIREFEITGFMSELHNEELLTYHETYKKEETLHDYIKGRISRYYKSYNHAEGFSARSQEDVIYFTLIDTQERLTLVYNALASQPGLNQTLYKNVYCPDLWYLEIYSTEASKQSAIDYLRKTYEFERIIGFGDNHNDVSLFNACDMRIAVENATTDLKAMADCICDTNDNDGVAKWLIEYHNSNINY